MIEPNYESSPPLVLKPCPFCGSEPRTVYNLVEGCSNENCCCAHRLYCTFAEWNVRPAESKLKASERYKK